MENQCLTCVDATFYLDNKNLCQECKTAIENCATCDKPIDTDLVCTKCTDTTFYLDKNLCQECSAIIDGCVTCAPGTTIPVCIKCTDKTYILDGDVCFSCATQPQCSEC